MTRTTVFPCPFCGHDDPEIGEVAPSEFAVDCPECRCIGPITGDVMSAIEAWNKAPRWPSARIISIEHTRRHDREPDDHYATAMEAGDNPWIR